MSVFLQHLSAAAFIAATSFAVSVSSLHAETVNCNSEGKDLQKAMDNSPAGAALFVTGSCDEGPYKIGRDLGLTGDGFTELSTNAAGNQVLVVTGGASVTLKNFNVDATGNIAGIHIVQGSSVVISNVDISGASQPAVNIDEASYAQVIASELAFNGTGVQLNGSSSAALIGDTITNNVIGISVGQFSTVALENNQISNNTQAGVAVSGGSYGLASTRGTPNVIESNGPVDVVCDAGGVFSADQPQTSSTELIHIDPDCRVFGTIF